MDADTVKASYDSTKRLYQAEVVEGNICVGSAVFEENGYGIDALYADVDKVTAKYVISNYTDRAIKPGVAVLAYYEGDVLQKVVLDTTTEFAEIPSREASGEYSITLDLGGITPKEGSYVRLYVWDDLANCAPVIVNDYNVVLNYGVPADGAESL